MRALTVEEIEKATKGRLLCGDRKHLISGISTDSRTIGERDLFFPIIGENFDGHDFIPSAIKNGVSAIVASKEDKIRDILETNIDIILVDDTLEALQQLAKYYISTLNIKKIAVTGSVGKTTTRDMLYYICKEKYYTGTTVGNFNNDIGVPLTVFSLEEGMEAAVIEMGMDHFDEIHRLVDIVRPDIGIITNVGISHMENLGSREGILKAKMEITDFFTEENTLVINEDCDMLNREKISGDYKVLSVGSEEKNDYIVSKICDFGEKGIKFNLNYNGEDREIRLNIPGAHNGINAALAIAACQNIGVSIDEAVRGLEKIKLTDKRLTILENHGIKVINDTYNACPESMKSALNTLINTSGKRKIAILGDMFELGKESDFYHAEVGKYAASINIDLIIAVGPISESIAKGGRKYMDEKHVLHFPEKEKLIEQLHTILKEGDVVLVKGSRGMTMEKIVEKIINE